MAPPWMTLKHLLRDQYNKEAAGGPQIGGAPQGGVTIPKPEGFEVKKDAVSSGMGDAFTQKLDDRMNQNPADVATKETRSGFKKIQKRRNCFRTTKPTR